jgi:hypothetical protein
MVSGFWMKDQVRHDGLVFGLFYIMTQSLRGSEIPENLMSPKAVHSSSVGPSSTITLLYHPAGSLSAFLSTHHNFKPSILRQASSNTLSSLAKQNRADFRLQHPLLSAT